MESFHAFSRELARIALPSGWQRLRLTDKGEEVFVLQAQHPAQALAVPLQGSGRHEVYLGLYRGRSGLAAMHVKVSTERFWRTVRPMHFIDDPGGAVQCAHLGAFDLRPGAKLLVRPTRSKPAALAYVRVEPGRPEAGGEHRGNFGVVFDVNGVMGYGEYDIEGPDDLRAVIAPYAGSDVDRICWGTAVGSVKPLYFSETLGYFGQEQRAFASEARERSARVMRAFAKQGVDPLRLIVDFAHEMGLQLWADDRVCKLHEPDFRDDHPGGRFLLEHRDKRVQNMDGSLHEQWTLSFAYPEIRDLKLRLLAEQARYGVDGIFLDFMRKPPIVGWEPAALDSFKAQYGEDPRHHDGPREDWIHEWMAHQCSFVTQFMRDLRASLDEVGRELGRRVPVAVHVPGKWHFGLSVLSSYFSALDVATWAREGLIDIVAPSASDCLWHEHVSLDRVGPMVRGTGCELWASLGMQARALWATKVRDKARETAVGDIRPLDRYNQPNPFPKADLDPWRVARSADDMYNQAAQGLFLWEAQELPVVLQRWDVLKRLGDRDWLRRTFGHPIGPFDGRHVFKQTVLDTGERGKGQSQ